MIKTKKINFRASEEEVIVIEKIAKRLERTPSDAMRTILWEFGKAMGIVPGKASIRVTVEQVDELPY